MGQKQKLPAIKAIKFNSCLCNELSNLWQALYQLYNFVHDRPIDTQLLNKIPLCWQAEQLLFSITKFKNVITKYSSFSILSPDHILWNYLKVVLDNTKCCSNIINITNTCINLSYWLIHFKKSIFIIISKLNKPFYNTLKVFHPIFLLNTLVKLIKKAINNKLQVTTNFIHSSQLGSIKQHLTIDTSIFLTYLIYIGWIKCLYMSTLVFNIV